jgi:IS5 family transposase
LSFKESNPTFTDIAVRVKLETVNSFLKEIDSIINFKKLKPILNKNSIGTKNVCGAKAYDNVMMFKILLIQKFYDLSDVKMEEALNVNLLFMRFTGLSLEDIAPDETRICRFRNSLINHKLYDKLFNSINRQLEDKGLIAKGGKHVLVDASLIKSDNDSIKHKTKDQRSENQKKVDEANRTLDLKIESELKKVKPSKKQIMRMLKKKERNSRTLKNLELDEIQKIDTKDIETSKEIIKENKDSYDHHKKIDKEIRIGYQAGKKEYASGYKGHIVTDVETGAILKPSMTFANTSDISTIDIIVEELDIKSLGADKAYKSEAIDELLEKKKIRNDICCKETKNMTDKDRVKLREEEKPKHKIRAKVEHSFALIKTQMKQSTTRFIGLVRNNMNFTITCIAANLKLFAHKKIRVQNLRIT